jgi:hypothetical protein
MVAGRWSRKHWKPKSNSTSHPPPQDERGIASACAKSSRSAETISKNRIGQAPRQRHHAVDRQPRAVRSSTDFGPCRRLTAQWVLCGDSRPEHQQQKWDAGSGR